MVDIVVTILHEWFHEWVDDVDCHESVHKGNTQLTFTMVND